MLEWNVFFADTFRRTIRHYNALSGYEDKFIEEYKNAKGNKEVFLERVDRILMSRFWSRCEYELIVSDWPPVRNIERKIDIYEQIKMNWKHFSEYVWKYIKRKVTKNEANSSSNGGTSGQRKNDRRK